MTLTAMSLKSVRRAGRSERGFGIRDLGLGIWD
jgi:hypothetical protein